MLEWDMEAFLTVAKMMDGGWLQWMQEIKLITDYTQKLQTYH